MAKLLVEIIGKNNQIIKKKQCEIEENTLIIEKGSKGRGKLPYKAEFTKKSIIYYKKYGFLLSQKVLLTEGSNKCIEFDTNETLLNYPTRKTIQKLFETEVLNKAGMLGTKIQIPTYITIMLFMTIILVFLTFLVTTGRVKI